MRLAEHPLVQRKGQRGDPPAAPERLDADWLKRVALEAGAADVGLVEIDRPELSDQRDNILAARPDAAHEVLCGLLPSVNGGHVRGDRTTKRNKKGGTG
jgi:hypothetical protein